jgi:hypothetical protein
MTGLVDWVFQHNTALMLDGSTMSDQDFQTLSAPCTQTSISNLWILDNVLSRQISGQCSQHGLTGLNDYMPNPSPLAPRFLGNAMFAPSGDTVYTWPAHNDATATTFTYVNPSSGNYQLLTPNWTDTSDGALAGINWAALQLALGGGGAAPQPPVLNNVTVNGVIVN